MTSHNNERVDMSSAKLLDIEDAQRDRLAVYRGTVDKPAIIQTFNPDSGDISSVMLKPEQIAQVIAVLAGQLS
ncbi:hypothetical protein WILE_82 [Mycobacterium phage Wile]|nr:hypothetical protein WILE_82 [Mycobacterium phage Wile]QAY06990.1 hypothetical protein SEA_DATWAY_84 [Mycobacterium phage Datway]QBP31288.1 hypothetical protein SEA_BUMBLEBEE11_83 [Mycobacterium phage Bumblebee11]QCW22732.1 hypothetical protein SEA_XENA_82 [Mycobacterium phage Xena]QXN74559.1 hypothetical protein SEA_PETITESANGSUE_84 [Mycobacterium Phage PetiteSangsue]WAB09413.1 hypothetical protein SEA_PERPLEXER_83 [Mycobacterium phage Perplexer]